VLRVSSQPGHGTEFAIHWKKSPDKEAVKP
jgi:hypothetical protein